MTMREFRIPGLRRVLRVSWSPTAVAREVDEEIRFHLDARTEEIMRLGFSESDARQRALNEYGDLEASRRELARVDRRRVRNTQRKEFFMSFADDARYASRSLRRRPALLAVTTLTLGLGIAANAIMFGVVDQLLLRPPTGVMNADAVKRVYYREPEDGKISTGPMPSARSGSSIVCRSPATTATIRSGSRCRSAALLTSSAVTAMMRST